MAWNDGFNLKQETLRLTLDTLRKIMFSKLSWVWLNSEILFNNNVFVTQSGFLLHNQVIGEHLVLLLKEF